MKKIINGLLLSTAIALLAFLISFYIPMGGVAIAIVLGILVGNFVSIDEKFHSGITYSEKTILAFAIALMGINLDFSILSSLGLKTGLIIVVGMVFTISLALFLGKLFKIDTKLALLVGIGNGVCGGSAIAATAPIIKSDKAAIGVSVAVVNLLGTLGIFILPPIAGLLDFNDIQAGVLIGNTLQAVGHVTAAGFAVGDLSGVSATTVKMGRVLLLTPLVLILIYYFAREGDADAKTVKFPNFILFFIGFSIIGSLSILPTFAEEIISETSHFALMVAMAGVGLKINFKDLSKSGKESLKLAGLVFKWQIIFTAVLIAFV